MIYEYGDMMSVIESTDNFLFTSNNVVTKYGRLVMGAGIARKVRDKVDNVDWRLGDDIYRHRSLAKDKKTADTYHMASTSNPLNPGGQIIAFQVKYDWKNQAVIELIEEGCILLAAMAKDINKRFDLNFPGIGFGGLSVKEVEPLLQCLPYNVHIWRFKKEENK